MLRTISGRLAAILILLLSMGLGTVNSAHALPNSLPDLEGSNPTTYIKTWSYSRNIYHSRINKFYVDCNDSVATNGLALWGINGNFGKDLIVHIRKYELVREGGRLKIKDINHPVSTRIRIPPGSSDANPTKLYDLRSNHKWIAIAQSIELETARG